ncbi:WPP domain interacting protein 1 [Striga asiatica]|uniref:WPP domain interacting protein 1 n=1 Tax=Striga asiatica TaxID=4170 RepID=A0A5A7RIF9_STRAF|nr:WPP domain interacting protein 1 [Striga asiatica]
MDSGNKSPGHAPAEDNEEVKKSETFTESKFGENGSLEDSHGGDLHVLPDVNGKGTEPSVPVGSSSQEMKLRKGYGLKKWRRIKRDVTRGRDSSPETGKMMMHEVSNLVSNPSKRTQVYAERQQKSEGSVSSPNPAVSNFGAFVGASVDSVGVDSENGEDHSSISSTAASFPNMKYDMPPVVGFPQDKGKMGILGGNGPSHHSGQRGEKGKGQVEAPKKARGERVKIEKENSRSSLESDLRSSNLFVFAQANHVMSNGVRSENGHEVQDGDGPFGNEGGYEPLSGDAEKGRGENHGYSSDHDLLLESMCQLQKAQEALEEEVLKFKEIGKDDVHPDLENESYEQFTCGEAVLDFSPGLQPKELEIAKGDLETELEDLFKQKIEAEVEYLTISRTVQKLRICAVDQNTIPVDQKLSASELTENKLGDEKGMSLEKDAEKLRDFSEDIESIDLTLKLQKKVCKYTTYFLVQLSSLFIIIGVFMYKLSPNYSEVVPT